MPQFNARYQQKIDTEANWDKAVNFIPMKGEFIIYAKDDTHSTERIKIGDGVTPVAQLSFASSGLVSYPFIGEGEILQLSEGIQFTHEIFGQCFSYDREKTNCQFMLPDQPYEITYNGQVYHCIAKKAPEGLSDDPETLTLGNTYPLTGNNTGEPFLIGISPRNNAIISMDLTGAQTATCGITGYGVILNTIKEKLLPSELISKIENNQSRSTENQSSISNLRYTFLPSNYVSSNTQTWTEAKKKQARKNIDAISLNDINIPEQQVSDLSETDSSKKSYVLGELQERHLPWYLPTGLPEDSYENRSTTPIVSYQKADLTDLGTVADSGIWSTLKQCYSIQLSQEVALNLTTVEGRILMVFDEGSEDEREIELPIYYLLDNSQPYFFSNNYEYGFGRVYNGLIIGMPEGLDFNTITCYPTHPAMDHMYRPLHPNLIPPMFPTESRVESMISSEIEELNEKVAPLIVNCTGSDMNITTDIPLEDIILACQNHRFVQAVYENKIFNLQSFDESIVSFINFDGVDIVEYIYLGEISFHEITSIQDYSNTSECIKKYQGIVDPKYYDINSNFECQSSDLFFEPLNGEEGILGDGLFILILTSWDTTTSTEPYSFMFYPVANNRWETISNDPKRIITIDQGYCSYRVENLIPTAEDLEVITLLLDNDMLPVLVEDENTVIAEKDGTMLLI